MLSMVAEKEFKSVLLCGSTFMRPWEKMLGSRTQQPAGWRRDFWCKFEKQKVWAENGGWFLSLTATVGLIKLPSIAFSKHTLNDKYSVLPLVALEYLTSCMFYAATRFCSGICPSTFFKVYLIISILTKLLRDYCSRIAAALQADLPADSRNTLMTSEQSFTAQITNLHSK